ncbi:photosystem I reaction center subunit II, chloroplastic-like [Cornus florida]|uniref:photosystem I reaction center subunit II, chloroplastic-like n=1 Tax=Cornus florida TaxID=4283 RepID=UPI0028A1B9FC|nr:photosystem I reaction center subunit II, chloroplastic-like [Cornus florida]
MATQVSLFTPISPPKNRPLKQSALPIHSNSPWHRGRPRPRGTLRHPKGAPVGFTQAGGVLRMAQVKEFYVIKEQIFEMVSGGAPIMSQFLTGLFTNDNDYFRFDGPEGVGIDNDYFVSFAI